MIVYPIQAIRLPRKFGRMEQKKEWFNKRPYESAAFCFFRDDLETFL